MNRSTELPKQPAAVVSLEMDAKQRSAARRRVRDGFGIDDATTAFLFPDIRKPKHAQRTVMTAFAQLQRQSHDVALLLVGPVRFRNQTLAHKLGLADVVRFVGKTRRLPDVHCAADVTLAAGDDDQGWCRALEALYLRTPAIVPAGNAAATLIADGEAGCVVDRAADAGAWAEVMAKLCAPEARAAAVGAIERRRENEAWRRQFREMVRMLTTESP